MLLRAILSEIYKLKRSAVLWLHIIMPIVGGLVFLLYFNNAKNMSYLMRLNLFMETVCIAFPLLIGIVCGLLCSKEEQTGNYQFVLSEIHSRTISYLSKLLLFCVLSAVSVSIAVGVFSFGLHGIAVSLIIKMAVAAWVGCIFIYILHLFVGFRFGRGASIGLGVFGSLISALMITGLGDKIWHLVPWAWGLRSCECLVLSVRNPEYAGWAVSQLQLGFIGCALMTIAALALSIIWFNCWEGSRSNE